MDHNAANPAHEAKSNHAAVGPAGGGVMFFPHAQVAAGFARGVPLIEPTPGGRFQIHTSRRDAVGLAEIHAAQTDIFYVQDGAGTLVTGGRVVDAHEIAPGETRGSAIEGGQVHRLTGGDVIVIPAGVPHWYSQVERVMTYFTVKIAS